MKKKIKFWNNAIDSCVCEVIKPSIAEGITSLNLSDNKELKSPIIQYFIEDGSTKI